MTEELMAFEVLSEEAKFRVCLFAIPRIQIARLIDFAMQCTQDLSFIPVWMILRLGENTL